MRVIIIGPLPPYRGGIAHSNYILCKNISKNNELSAISFSRLFPKTILEIKKLVFGHLIPLGLITFYRLYNIFLI